MFGFVKKALIRLAKKVLQGILSQLTQQFSIVQDQALSPMRAIVQEVVGGVWIGEGANAFVEEINSLMIPGVGQVCDNITFCHSGLQFAQETMERADQEVNNKINALGDVFAAVF